MVVGLFVNSQFIELFLEFLDAFVEGGDDVALLGVDERDILGKLLGHRLQIQRLVVGGSGEPLVVHDVFEGHALLRLPLDYAQDEAFGQDGEIIGKADVHIEYVLLDHLLGLGPRALHDEGRAAGEQLVREHANAPNIKFFVVARLVDHFGSQVVEGAAVGLPGFVEEVGPAEI